MEQKNKNKINSNEKTLLPINFRIFAFILSTLSICFLCGCNANEAGNAIGVFFLIGLVSAFLYSYVGGIGIIGALLLLFSVWPLLGSKSASIGFFIFESSHIRQIMFAAGLLFILVGTYMQHKKKKAAMILKMETNREYVKSTGVPPCNECKGTGYLCEEDGEINICENCCGHGYLQTEEEEARFRAKERGVFLTCLILILLSSFVAWMMYSCNDDDEKKEKIKIELISNKIKWNEYGTAKFSLKNTGCDLEKQTIEFKTHGYSNGKEITRTSRCKIDFWPANAIKKFEIGNSEFVDSNLDRICFTIKYEDVEKEFDWPYNQRNN